MLPRTYTKDKTHAYRQFNSYFAVSRIFSNLFTLYFLLLIRKQPAYLQMPQDDLKQNDKNNFPRFRPRGDDDNGSRKGPKFSIYWIWGIIAAVLIGFNLFGTFAPDAHQIDEYNFRKSMLANGDVEKIDLISNKQLVRVYIKKDSLAKTYYAKYNQKNSWPGGIGKEGP